MWCHFICFFFFLAIKMVNEIFYSSYYFLWLVPIEKWDYWVREQICKPLWMDWKHFPAGEPLYLLLAAGWSGSSDLCSISSSSWFGSCENTGPIAPEVVQLPTGRALLRQTVIFAVCISFSGVFLPTREWAGHSTFHCGPSSNPGGAGGKLFLPE